MPITKKEADALTTAIAKFVATLIKEDRARIATLEHDLAAFKAEPHLKYLGTWKRGTSYVPGNTVTHRGSLWTCRAETSGEPEKDFDGWQLSLKRGDAR